MNRFKVLGINDEKSFCQCCGRTGLKKVVWIEDTETGGVEHYGTTCAENPAKAFGLKAEIKSAANHFKAVQVGIVVATYPRYRAAGGGFTPMNDKHETEFTDRALFDRLYEEVKAERMAKLPRFANC